MKCVDIGIVIALKEEFEYFIKVAPSFFEIEFNDVDGYLEFLIDIDSNILSGVICVVGKQGNSHTKSATDKLLLTYDVNIITLLGISGRAIDDVRVGDIIIAGTAFDYFGDATKVTDRPIGVTGP